MSTNQIVSKVWSFCSKPPYNRTLGVPAAYNWQSLTGLRGAELEVHYSITLRELGKEKGIPGQIFSKSQNKIQYPAVGTSRDMRLQQRCILFTECPFKQHHYFLYNKTYQQSADSAG